MRVRLATRLLISERRTATTRPMQERLPISLSHCHALTAMTYVSRPPDRGGSTLYSSADALSAAKRGSSGLSGARKGGSVMTGAGCGGDTGPARHSDDDSSAWLDEQFAQPAAGKPGVDEHSRALGLQKGAVARAAAAEDLKTHRHGGAQA